ncbi:glycosyltransferase family 1 protein [Sulfurovum sp.]|uniref:glycosyltransferase family 4 protein n=1 Tax=Sulfurovum sp. TaxID=1969726 RepID=UPI0025EAF741|nr:glycosyltransferase family 1 protein [Sulfurovum sp.]
MIIDVTRFINRKCIQKRFPTGIDRVDYQYLEHYAARSTALVRVKLFWFYLSHSKSQKLFKLLLENEKCALLKIFLVILQSVFEKKNISNKLLLNISHSGLHVKNYDMQIKRHKLRPVYFIHDLIPIRYPEYAGSGEEKRHTDRLKHVLAYAHGIIVNSHDTLEDIKLFAKEEERKMPPALVAHLGMSSDIRRHRDEILNSDYFVMLGTIEPRKNHWLMLHIWRDMVVSLGEHAPKLVIIGQEGWDSRHVIHMLTQSHKLKDHVIYDRSCSDTKLSQYLTHAKALLFPSFYEGYGIPLLEAISIGTPVIASDLPVFRELANNIPEYLNPLDVNAWAEMIIGYSQKDSKRRDAQLRRMKDFKPYVWKEHFLIVDEFIKKYEDHRE